ncbi:MAG TPA: hypothetical protein VKP88_06610, partial [Candidatus Paceibacterota bacterium]|nr:hypothetical protein [Candidatus Paceibacterota bacterium]
ETANPADTKPAAAQEAEVPVPTAEPPTPASEALPQTAETATAPVPPTNDRWQASPDASVPPPAPAAPATENTSTAPTVDAGAPLRSVAAVADEIEVTKPKEEPKVPQPATGDPLMAESVTAGLEQLLTEWSLFKGGGILGSGPKGVEHPLYKELRNLPMNLVIAGRFEGATPEVKQSIHDYMNGWRYEQGMTHDLQETFEHYLRRVVSTIIDKQAKSS